MTEPFTREQVRDTVLRLLQEAGDVGLPELLLWWNTGLALFEEHGIPLVKGGPHPSIHRASTFFSVMTQLRNRDQVRYERPKSRGGSRFRYWSLTPSLEQE